MVLDAPGAVPLAPQKVPTIKYDIKYAVRNDIHANALAKFWISEPLVH